MLVDRCTKTRSAPRQLDEHGASQILWPGRARLSHNQPLPPPSASAWVRRTLAESIRSRKPYAVNLLLAGYDISTSLSHLRSDPLLYYSCLAAFREQTGESLEYPYFANTLLVQYLNRHPETESWKVTA